MRVADVGPQLGHGGELGALGRPLIGGLGQLLDLDLFDEHPERDDAPRGRPGRRGEGEDGTGLGAVQLAVELGDDRAAAHLVEVVVDADHFGAARVVAVQVDGDQIAVDGGPPTTSSSASFSRSRSTWRSTSSSLTPRPGRVTCSPS
jgi:hypothetical protein